MTLRSWSVSLTLAASVFCLTRVAFDEPGMGMFCTSSERASASELLFAPLPLPFSATRTRDKGRLGQTYIGAEADDPGECELTRLQTLFLRKPVKLVDNLEIVVECLALESGHHALERALGDIFGRLPLSRNESSARVYQSRGLQNRVS